MVESKQDLAVKNKGSKIFGIILITFSLIFLLVLLSFFGSILSSNFLGESSVQVMGEEVSDPLVGLVFTGIFFLIFLAVILLFLAFGWGMFNSKARSEFQIIMDGVKFARQRHPEKIPTPELTPVGPVDFVGNEKPTYKPFIFIPFLLPTPMKNLAKGMNMKHDVQMSGLPINIPFVGKFKITENISGTYKGGEVFIKTIPMLKSSRGSSNDTLPDIEITFTTPYFCQPVILMSRSRSSIRIGDMTPLDWSKVKSGGFLGKALTGAAGLLENFTGIDMGTDLPTVITKDPNIDVAFNIMAKNPSVLPVFQLPWVRSGLLGLGFGTYLKFDGRQIIARLNLTTLKPSVIYKILNYLIALSQHISKQVQPPKPSPKPPPAQQPRIFPVPVTRPT